MQAKQITIQHRQFHDAENLWFWFLSSRRIQNGFVRNRGSHESRPCELVDVETLISRLYLSGQLSNEQLQIMKEYGDRRRCPNQHVLAENKAAALWSDAMKTIECAAAKKGWIERR